MKTFKVSEIVDLANNKYDLYGLDLDEDVAKTKRDTYEKMVRKSLREDCGYPKLDPKTKKKGYKNIDIATAKYIINDTLKDYFISNSNNRDFYYRSEELNQAALQQYQDKVKHFAINNPTESPEEDDQRYNKEKKEFLSHLKNQSASVSLDEVKAKYPHLRYMLNKLDKALDKAKLNYVFETIVKQNNVSFDQNKFIEDFFERADQIDDSNIAYEEINAEYVKLNDKLSSLSSYIK